MKTPRTFRQAENEICILPSSNGGSLEEWYESPLQPGHYQLVVRKRFRPDGDWVESNPVTFDVIPRKLASPIPDSLSLRLVPDGLKSSPQMQTYRLGYDEGVAVEMINDSDNR